MPKQRLRPSQPLAATQTASHRRIMKQKPTMAADPMAAIVEERMERRWLQRLPDSKDLVCKFCHRSKSQCPGWRRAGGVICSTCPRIYKWCYSPSGFSMDGMCADVNKDQEARNAHLQAVMQWEEKNEGGHRVRSAMELGLGVVKVRSHRPSTVTVSRIPYPLQGAQAGRQPGRQAGRQATRLAGRMPGMRGSTDVNLNVIYNG